MATDLNGRNTLVIGLTQGPYALNDERYGLIDTSAAALLRIRDLMR